MTNNEKYHIPVLLNSCIDGLNIKPGNIYVDVTFGGGGHSRLIHDNLKGLGHLYSFDQDEDAADNCWKLKTSLLLLQISNICPIILRLLVFMVLMELLLI